MNTLTALQDFTGEELTTEDQVVASLEEEFCLDTLLSDSLLAVAKDQTVKDARKKLTKGGMDELERAYIEAIVHKWELERLWDMQASVMLFEVQHCTNCGAKHHHFAGYFQRQSHKTSKIMRWQKIDASQVAASSLPKERKEDVVAVTACHSCCDWEPQSVAAN